MPPQGVWGTLVTRPRGVKKAVSIQVTAYEETRKEHQWSPENAVKKIETESMQSTMSKVSLKSRQSPKLICIAEEQTPS